MDNVSLCCWMWSKMKQKKNTTTTRSLLSYYFKTMKKERKKRNGHDKNRFSDKIMCLLCCVMYNTYNELSSLFSCQIGSQYVVGWVLVGGTKKKWINTSIMSSSSSFSSCFMLNVYDTGSFLLWVCVCNMTDTEKNIISDYNEEKKRKKQRNDIIKTTDL